MLCVSQSKFDPVTGQQVRSYGCGQCIACKINHRRKWTGRLILETIYHQQAAWVTLTYDDKNLPADQALNKRHLKRFAIEFQKKFKGTRYFGAGEYGDQTARSHYHLIIWGYTPTFCMDLKGRWFDPNIEKLWGKGGTMAEDLMLSKSLEARAQYISGYVVKKFSKVEYEEQKPIIVKAELSAQERIDNYFASKWEEEHQPEFSIFSRMPGIGVPATKKLAKMFTSDYGSQIIANLGGAIPGEFRYNGKTWPFARIIRQKIADHLGYELLPIPQGVTLKTIISYDGFKNEEIQIPVQEEDTPKKALFRHIKAAKRISDAKLNRMAQAAKYTKSIPNAFQKTEGRKK